MLVKIRAVLKALGPKKRPVLISSNVGALPTAMAIGRMIRTKDLDIRVARTFLSEDQIAGAPEKGKFAHPPSTRTTGERRRRKTLEPPAGRGFADARYSPDGRAGAGGRNCAIRPKPRLSRRQGGANLRWTGAKNPPASASWGPRALRTAQGFFRLGRRFPLAKTRASKKTYTPDLRRRPAPSRPEARGADLRGTKNV
jgi:hypothetical protein